MTSVIDYLRKTGEQSVSISSDRARTEPVQKCKHARRDRDLPEFFTRKRRACLVKAS